MGWRSRGEVGSIYGGEGVVDLEERWLGIWKGYGLEI